jgi:GntR family transcriptional regulator/MocR family aminotransferase
MEMADIRKSYISPPDPNADKPYYWQIYDRFLNAFSEGVLKPGDRIPAARALAKELGLARGTVESAYSLLAAEGYILPRGQAGTIVSPDIKPQRTRPPPARSFDPLLAPITYRPDTVLPFQMGLPALDAFPRKIWARLGARLARAMQPEDMVHPDVRGLSTLRTQLAAYLQVSRGIDCSPEQVFVTGGYRHSIELVSHSLLNAGDNVWLESPGYPPTRRILEHMKIAPVPVAVDGDGMIVQNGIKAAPRARAAVVTPAHQSPLSMSLSLPRRLALLNWASETKAWIVEDDYDGEYRYVSRPLPALKSLDRDGRVVYTGTFSKVLFPAIRLSYLVVPEAQVETFERVAGDLSGGSPWFTQAIVSDFMKEGHFARHIQRMRRLYSERREATIAGLELALGERKVRIDPQPGGMHLILRVPDVPDHELVSRMRADGLYAEALSDWTFEGNRMSAILVNFTNVTSRSMAEELGIRISKLLDA